MDLTVSVVSSIVASALIALGTYLYPVLLRLLGRGVREISGAWKYHQNPGTSGRGRQSGEASIRQWGTHVWVRFAITRRLDGTPYPNAAIQHFRVRARWRNDELIGTFVDSRARHRRGALVLHWRSGALVGKSMYVENNPSQVTAQTDSSSWVTVHEVRLSTAARSARVAR